MNHKHALLIVEDQKENIDILIETLQDRYEIYVSTNGDSVMQMLPNIKVDLILLDIMMPEKDGYEVCAEIKEDPKFKDIPVIFLTGQDNLEDKKRGFDLGAVDYITKPFSVDEVKVRINAQIIQNESKLIVARENELLLKEVDKKEVLLENAYNNLEHAYLETIERLSRAAEYRDDETGNHVKRVGKYSAIIAQKLGFSQGLVHAIEHAAPLHDIGKIGIPESILLKPGKLDPEEWQVMKTHTTIGKEILHNSSSNIINLAEIIAHTHHERWDGKGYPLGLKGNQIPKVSRVVAIADVFDALLSSRPYKKSVTFNEAINIILEEEEGHFSPDVVNAFLSSLDEIEKVTLGLSI